MHRQLTRRRALRLAPALRRSALTGALLYWDAQVDDARYVVTWCGPPPRTARSVASRTQVTGFLREGERVTGVRAVDLESGAELQIRAQQVVNATGVWTDEIQAMVGGRGSINVRASKGMHLVVPRDRIHSHTGIILRTPTSVLFVIPWGRHWIIGTTDTDWALSKAHPAASRTDIDYMLGQINKVLAVPLTRDDVEGVYAGLRPLLAGESDSTSKLSREHTVAHPVPGLVMIAGGKYTTYRLMARDAVDAVAHGLDGKVAPSCTDRVPLAGADGYPALWNSRARAGHVLRAARRPDRAPAAPVRDADRRGTRPDRRRPEPGAGRSRAPRTTCGSRSCTRSRTRAPGTWTTCWPGGPTSRSRPGTGACRRPTRSLSSWPGRCGGGPGRWPGNWRTTGCEIAAERKSQEADTDTDADAIRLGAPDIVPVLSNGRGATRPRRPA